jgi:hypothetical protein
METELRLVLNQCSTLKTLAERLYDQMYRTMKKQDMEKAICYSCQQTGHFASKCPTCYNCQEKGHYATACPQKKRDTGCWTCKETGHYARDCPHKSIEPEIPVEPEAPMESERTKRPVEEPTEPEPRKVKRKKLQ